MTIIPHLVNLANGEDKLAAKICRDAIAEIKRLRAIVDKLPKTADGVPVVPGMYLCGEGLEDFLCAAIECDEPGVILCRDPNGDESYVKSNACYSTGDDEEENHQT